MGQRLIVLTSSARALLEDLIATTELLEPVVVLMSRRDLDAPARLWGVCLTERLELIGKQLENVSGLQFYVDDEATILKLSVDIIDGQLVIAELPSH